MDRKLKELILYIADKCKDDPSFGATKLNKILFLADMNYYALHGKSITGSTYIHKPNGPVAKRMLPALHSLKKEKSATILEDLYFGYVRKKVVPGRGPNMSLFTEEQISLVTFLVEKTMGMTATEISRWSHTLNPWLLTCDGEEIPYHTVFSMYRLPVEEDGINWGKRELKKIRVAAAKASAA